MLSANEDVEMKDVEDEEEEEEQIATDLDPEELVLLTLCTDIMSVWQPCDGYLRLNTISNL